jgi:hypothetical protein
MLAGDVCALTHRLELFPNNRRVDLGLVKRLRRESVVGAGHDIFTAHELRKTDQPLGDPFRMFNNVPGVGGLPRANDFSVGQLYALEQMVLVLVVGVRRLGLYEPALVDLKQKARIDDCAIFLADLGSERVEVLFFGPVVLVDAPRLRAPSDIGSQQMLPLRYCRSIG